MAQPGTAQFFLSGTCKKRVYPELHPCERMPRNQTDACGHPLYTRGKSSPILERRQRLRSRLPAVLGRGVLVLWVTAEMKGVPTVRGEFLMEEIRDGAGLCPELSQEHGIKVQHTKNGVFFFSSCAEKE